MSKNKKNKDEAKKPRTPVEQSAPTEPVDPHATLKLPADPPRPFVLPFLLASLLLALWLVYLMYVAWQG